MRKEIPIFIGIIMLFVLQLASYIMYLLNQAGAINGTVDKYLLLKTPLVILPLLLIIFAAVNLVLNRKK